LFEYAVHRLVLKRLLPRLEQAPPAKLKYDKLVQVLASCRSLLSTLAYSGARDDAQADRAFGIGVAKLQAGDNPLTLLPRDQTGLGPLDRALDELASAAPLAKRSVLEACAACIGADARVTVEEGELLRVISHALACPMPPLLNARSG
jgi:hypothetical protein